MNTIAQKMTALLLAVIIMTSALTACRKTKSNAEETGADSASSAVEKTLSDDLFSYELSIDGHVYSLPCPVSEFEEHGWVIHDDNDLSLLDRSKIQKVDIADELDSCQVWIEGNLCAVPMKFNEFTQYGWKVKEDSYGTYVKNDKELWIGMKTTGELKQPHEDSLITEFYIRFDNGFEYVILPGNFIFDKQTTAQEVINQYGQPDEPIYNYYNGYELIYHLNESGSSFIRFSIPRPDNADTRPEYHTVIIRKTPGE